MKVMLVDMCIHYYSCRQKNNWMCLSSVNQKHILKDKSETKNLQTRQIAEFRRNGLGTQVNWFQKSPHWWIIVCFCWLLFAVKSCTFSLASLPPLCKPHLCFIIHLIYELEICCIILPLFGSHGCACFGPGQFLDVTSHLEI